MNKWLIEKTVAVSGGMDPIHVGHLRMIQEARKTGLVTVILNSDEWLMRKKGFVFMPYEERAEIINAVEGVWYVIKAKDDDGSVCETLRDLHKEFGLTHFANGGDRKSDNIPEVEVCNELGIEMIWNVGGEKIQSSSDLVKNSQK